MNQIWTPAKSEKLRELVSSGLSITASAKLMGEKKGTALKNAKKAGIIPAPRVKKPRPPKPPKQPRVKATPKAKVHPSRREKKGAVMPAAPRVHVEPIVEKTARQFRKVLGSPAALMARDPDQCNWPIGSTQEPDFHFCTNERARFRTNRSGDKITAIYCQGHQQAAEPAASVDWYESRAEWARANPDLPVARKVLKELADRKSIERAIA